jgi:uncharacterized membrane protein YidH (DUF202 family)
MKAYAFNALYGTNVNDYLKKYFGDVFEIEANDRPISYRKMSRFFDMANSKGFMGYHFRTSGSMIGFDVFASKIQPSLTKAFGETLATSIINEYLEGKGYRFQLLYSIYNILCKKMNKFYSINTFSEIFFGKGRFVHTILQRPDPRLNVLNTYLMMEFAISRLEANKDLGFKAKDSVILEIQSECRPIIRSAVIREFQPVLNPVSVSMIWESILAFSEKYNRYISVNDVSEKIFKTANPRTSLIWYLTSQRPIPSGVATNLHNLLVRKGIAKDHMAVQWTELFLKTRGLQYIKFDVVMNVLDLVSTEARTSTISVLSSARVDMFTEIVWGLTCGRSWLTGEEVSFDDAVLHHVLHDPITGLTLYGAAYESSIENYAMLTKKQNIGDVEKPSEKLRYQALFKYMWEKLKEGDFRAATAHWKKPYQTAFLRERTSKKYLDYWLSFL